MKLLYILIGIMWLIISISVTIKITPWISIIGEWANTDDILKIIYWTGVTIFILLIDLVSPIYIIKEGMTDEQTVA